MSGIPAKTYSIWNGWNPPGITWNPHGIWGQGKDLHRSCFELEVKGLDFVCLVNGLLHEGQFKPIQKILGVLSFLFTVTPENGCGT